MDVPSDDMTVMERADTQVIGGQALEPSAARLMRLLGRVLGIAALVTFLFSPGESFETGQQRLAADARCFAELIQVEAYGVGPGSRWANPNTSHPVPYRGPYPSLGLTDRVLIRAFIFAHTLAPLAALGLLLRPRGTRRPFALVAACLGSGAVASMLARDLHDAGVDPSWLQVRAVDWPNTLLELFAVVPALAVCVALVRRWPRAGHAALVLAGLDLSCAFLMIRSSGAGYGSSGLAVIFGMAIVVELREGAGVSPAPRSTAETNLQHFPARTAAIESGVW